MTKKEAAAKLMPKPKTNFTPEEVVELSEMLRLMNGEKYKAAQVKANTALVPRGKEVAEELEAIARILENAKNGWMSAKMVEHGYANGESVTVNLTTGEITQFKEDGPKDSE
jgi:hypothetical protein